MSNEQGRRAGQSARLCGWSIALFVASLSVSAPASAQSVSAASCDAGRSWIARPVADFAVRAAIQRAGLSGRSAASDVAARARATAWLPTVSARAGRGLNASASSAGGLLPSERAAESEALSFEVRVVFRLDHAFFSGVELDAERAEVQRAERRRAIERDVIDALVVMEHARRESPPCGTAGTSAVTVPAIRARAMLESWVAMDADELRRRATR
jgi:hypothetical protein